MAQNQICCVSENAASVRCGPQVFAENPFRKWKINLSGGCAIFSLHLRCNASTQMQSQEADSTSPFLSSLLTQVTAGQGCA